MKKIKQFLESEKGKDILIVFIVILVGLGSFELGRLSNGNTQEDVKIVPADQNISPNNDTNQPDNSTQTSMNNTDVGRLDSGRPTSAVLPSGKTFFASSRGKKYYTITCSAGKTIKQENKVWFSTGKEAEAAGYTLSSSCS